MGPLTVPKLLNDTPRFLSGAPFSCKHTNLQCEYIIRVFSSFFLSHQSSVLTKLSKKNFPPIWRLRVALRTRSTAMSENPVTLYGVVKVLPLSSGTIIFYCPSYTLIIQENNYVAATILRRREGEGGLLIPTHSFDYSRFVLVIYLGEIITACDGFHYRTRLRLLPFLFDAPYDNSGVLRPLYQQLYQ